MKKRLFVFIFAFIFINVFIGIDTPTAKEKENDVIHFIKLKEADAILIESNGLYGMVDCGDDKYGEDGSKYENKVVNYLNELGVNKLEFLIITHCHNDHMGEAPRIIKEFNPSKVYYKEYFSDNLVEYEANYRNDDYYNNLLKALEENKNHTSSVVLKKDTSFLFGDFFVEILNGAKRNTHIYTDENHNSLGVLLTKGNKKVFLAGDINNAYGKEDEMIENYFDKLSDIDLLKVAHHGRNFSSSYNFIKMLSPTYAIITGGEFFEDEPKKVFYELNIPVYSTYRNGDIRVNISDENIYLLAEKKELLINTKENFLKVKTIIAIIIISSICYLIHWLKRYKNIHKTE